MAAMTQPLVNLDQPKPKIVPKANSPQAVVLQPARMVKIQVRPRERRPSHLLLGTINHCDFRVIKALPLHLDTRGNSVIASWREIDEFGTGATMSQACDDLGHTLAELYSSLKADESRLGPDLARVWGILQRYIKPRS